MAVRLQSCRSRATRRSAAVTAFTAIGLTSGCITPTIVRPAVAENAIPLDTFPPGTELVALPVGEGGAVLRGVFVPAGPGAPVVLHFQEACTTIAFGGMYGSPGQEGQGLPAVWDLRGLGLASLVVDYRGVGMSTGERDNANLAVDAATAFAEATRRAGGDPGRVVVRGNSLGTLAAATLLEADARPGAVVLIAPVRAETVGANFLRFALWDVVAVPLGWLIGSALDLSLDHAVARGQVPLAVIAPFQDLDGFLSEAETKALQRAVEQGHGRWMPDGVRHNDVSKGACSLTENERKFYLELFAGQSHATERAAALCAALPSGSAAATPRGRALVEMLSHFVWLSDPQLADALATCHVPSETLVAWVPWLERNRGVSSSPAVTESLFPVPAQQAPASRRGNRGVSSSPAVTESLVPVPAQQALASRRGNRGDRVLPADGWQRILDLGEDASDAATNLLVETAIPLSGMPALRRPDALAALLADLVHAEDKLQHVLRLRNDGRVVEELVGAACCRFLDWPDGRPLDARIGITMRILLKAASIPDRVATREDGTRVLEAWCDGAWRTVPVPSAGAASWPRVERQYLPRNMPVQWPGFSIPLPASMALLRARLPDWLRQRLDADAGAVKRLEEWMGQHFALLDWPKATATLALADAPHGREDWMNNIEFVLPHLEHVIEVLEATGAGR